jgi:dTMP kinase
MRGKFITFEGGEGSGKSTHAATLAARLKSLGVDFVLTREPGGSTGAEIIRHILLSGIAKPLGAETETILFAAARDDHVRATILPALEAGKWVICDRFIDSTRVYQGEAGGLPGEIIDVLNHMVVSPTFPDLTLMLDVPAELGLGRAHSRRVDKVNPDTEADAYEKRDLAFHWKLRDAFREIARAEPERCVIIDAAQEERAVFAAVWQAVQSRLLAHHR